jgi:hypothetical protein
MSSTWLWMIEEQMGEVIVTMNSKKQVQGITYCTWGYSKNSWHQRWDWKYFKTLPGVNSNNELSTQYAVGVEIMMRI